MRVIDYAARATNERMFMAENRRRTPIKPKPEAKPVTESENDGVSSGQ